MSSLSRCINILLLFVFIKRKFNYTISTNKEDDNNKILALTQCKDSFLSLQNIVTASQTRSQKYMPDKKKANKFDIQLLVQL